MNEISQLTESLQRGNLAFFLGGDLPQEVTGLPSRTDLAVGLAQRLELGGPPLPLPEVAARYEARLGRHALVRWLRDQLPFTGKTPQPFHRRLVELAERHGVKTFITTAYDSLLAIAFEQAGVARDGVLRNSDLRFADPARPMLIWLYGKVEQVDSLVVTEQDHWNLLRDRDREEVVDEVKRALRQNTVLFVGYDLSDPDFRFLFNEVADSRFARLAYAVWPGCPEDQARLWRERGIVLLDAEPLAVFDQLVGTTVPPEQALHTPEISEERPVESMAAPQPAIPAFDPDNPPIAAIRDLLEAAFTAETLKRFCRDRPGFRPLVTRFSTSDGLSDMVERVIVYCGEFFLWDKLLAGVQEGRPRQFARFESRLRDQGLAQPPHIHQRHGIDATVSSQRKAESKPSVPSTSESQSITWLHLSDLHFCQGEAYDENIVLGALLQDVKDRIKEDGLRPDFVVITGDIAYASRPDEYDMARQFFDELLAATGLGKDRLFPVPGNHDVDRKAITTLAGGATSILNNRRAVNRFLTSDAERDLVFQRFHNYGDFVNDYLAPHLAFDSANYFFVRQFEMTGRSVAVLGLNSAWLAASNEDRNRLLLGERQVRDALKAAGAADLRLAAMHHPFDWLQDFDRSDAEPLLCGGCDFVLHGHMHGLSLLQARDPDAAAFIIAAGACYDTRNKPDRPNSYNLVRLDFGTGQGTVHLRMYSDRRGGFWTKDVVNYRNVEDGTYSFPLRGE